MWHLPLGQLGLLGKEGAALHHPPRRTPYRLPLLPPRHPLGLAVAPGRPSCCSRRAPGGAVGRAGAGGGSGSAWGWAVTVRSQQPRKSLELAAYKPASGERLGLFTVFLLKGALLPLFQR